ncbi:MAG: hypothetical protein KKB34_06750 [Bacteroidetes bacterium]|nr:hypothetical protein [Bacteroidota bacterium]
MPLKNPKELPKIPKTRKKKALSAIDAVPDKKPDKLEYICRSFYHYDKLSKKQLCVFRLETIAEFTSFAYEVSVESIKDKYELFFVLMGLEARANMVPEVQPAITDLSYEDLVGEYIVNIVKQDGAINSARFKINPFKKEIVLIEEFKPKKKNNRLFCKFEVAEEHFTFAD